jgi:hypothetical protein
MSWTRRSILFSAVTAVTLLGAATPALASTNSGWVYTTNDYGAVYFDADLNGYPGLEKITVCDNESNGWGIEARVIAPDDEEHDAAWTVKDPTNDGKCVAIEGNLFVEEMTIEIWVREYSGTLQRAARFASAVS